MLIQEQLNRVNSSFEKFHDDFVRLNSAKEAIEKHYAPKVEEIAKKYQPEIDALESSKNALLSFFRLIQNYTRKVASDNCQKMLKPDFPQLYSMIDRLEDLRSKDIVAAHRCADQMADLINANVAYINDKLNIVKSNLDKELFPINNAKNKTLAEFRERQKNLYARIESYISGDDIKSLNTFLNHLYQDYKITDDYFGNWSADNQTAHARSTMLLGIKRMQIKVPKFACEKVKKVLGGNFNENTKTVVCPVIFNTDSCEEISVEYTERNELQVYNGVQALILNFLRYFTTGFKVSLFDFIHYNAVIFGSLAAFTKGKNSLIDRVIQNENGVKNSIALMADYYRKRVEGRIGIMTVHEYNKQCRPEERIPLRILIVNRKQNQSSNLNGVGDLAYLLNNAKRFGITLLRLEKNCDGGSKEIENDDNENENSRPVRNAGKRIISDSDGRFYIYDEEKWIPFKWISAPEVVPDDDAFLRFVENVRTALKPSEKGTLYFKRYEMHVPEKSIDKRKPIVLPFGVDDDDNVISCNFENETFAAYLMGASGSGKSTLLHTLIAGIMMNYHPDEVELWLLDFKMTEFKRYVDCRPPHVKYILLEKSEDLVFDIIDRLTEILDRRQYLFSQNHWSKLKDVPLDKNMPAIFIIIDEFAQMSQILAETKGNGLDKDYCMKLENLLAKGRALGMKFIFASQTYSDGIRGLTETAKKQIQMRFAMKNEAFEIKDTLNLASNELTDTISEYISSLPAYQTLFKSRDESGKVITDRYRNMYTENGEIEVLINKINDAMKPLPFGSATDNSTYIEKNSVAIDGSQPKTFESQIEYYEDFEAKEDSDFVDAGDVFIYPGVPCSFNLARPFALCSGTAENILLAGGQKEEKISVLMSVLKSYEKTGCDVEIWAHERTVAFRKYKNRFENARKISDLARICGRISKIKSEIQAREVTPGLIVCMGYELMASDFEILGGSDFISAPKSKPKQVEDNKPQIPTLSEILERVKNCPDPDEKRRIIAEYNASVQEYNAADKKAQEEEVAQEEEELTIRDARGDLEWILKNGSFFGLHFLFYFEQGCDFVNLRMRSNVFKHKILFSMSKDDAMEIGCRKASAIDAGTFVYSNGKDVYTMRPHIFSGIPLNGWIVDDEGNVEQRME